MKVQIFGKRMCTYCGKTMHYFEDGGRPFGVCKCGNIDYCDDQTKEQVIKRYGERLIKSNEFTNIS